MHISANKNYMPCLRRDSEKCVNFVKVPQSKKIVNPFQHSVAFYIETSHLICSVYQMTGFFMKCNTGLKWVNLVPLLLVLNKYCKKSTLIRSFSGPHFPAFGPEKLQIRTLFTQWNLAHYLHY